MSKNSLSFQLTKIIDTAPGIINNKIHKMPILTLRKNRLVGQTKNNEMKIADTIHINGLVNFESQTKILNPPVDIDIEK